MASKGRHKIHTMMNQVANVVVGLNNGALSHLLNGDFDQATEMLRSAYVAFDTCKRQISLMPSYHNAYATTVDVAATVENATSRRPRDSTQDSIAYDDRHFFQDTGVSSPSSSNFSTSMDVATSPLIVINYLSDDSIEQRKSNTSRVPGARSSSKCSLESSSSTAHSMYNRALVLSSDQDDFSLFILHQRRTGAIILYNLALVYHNIGIHLGLSSALPYALRLYILSLKSIDQESNIQEVQKLLMAILNNLGNIYTHFHCMEETERCLESLRIVLAASTHEITADEDYSFFFLNAVFQSKELCFAPAA